MSSDWKKHKVSDLIADNILIVGDGYRAKNSELSISGIPFARAGNINNGFQFKDADFFPTDQLGKVKEKISYSGDVVFTSKGTVGRFAYVKQGTQQFVYSPQLCFWRSLNSDKIHPRFLYYWMHSREFEAQVNAVKGQTDMADYVSLKEQRRMNISIPDIKEQIEIVNVLSSIDDKIELNNAINKNLEEMSQALFKRWFVDFEFPNENGEPYKSSGGEFEESELGLIPKGWKVTLLAEFCDISTEGENPSLSTDVTFEHYSIPAFDDSKMPVFELGSEIKSNKYKVQKNSILVSKLNPETRRVWKPHCLTENAICSTEFINFIPKDHDLNAFCYSVLISERFHQFLTSNTTGSTNSRQRVKPKATLSFQIAIGDKSITTYFNKTVDAIFKQIFEHRLLNKKLADTRDALLPKLMSGEIRVPLKPEYSQNIDMPIAEESKEQYSTT